MRPHQYLISHLEIKEHDRNREDDGSMPHSDLIRLKQTNGIEHIDDRGDIEHIDNPVNIG